MEKRIINKMIRAMKIKNTDIVLVNFGGTKDQSKDLDEFLEGFETENISYLINDCTDEKLMELVDEYPNGLQENWLEQFVGATVVVDIMDKTIGVPPVGLAKEKNRCRKRLKNLWLMSARMKLGYIEQAQIFMI